MLRHHVRANSLFYPFILPLDVNCYLIDILVMFLACFFPLLSFIQAIDQYNMPLQIIGAGYSRTGTLSLCQALETLG